MISRLVTVFIFVLIFHQNSSWPVLPQLHSNSRSQFLVLQNDGGYRYGYDTGDGSTAEQISDSSNQVFGQYSYKNELGQEVKVKYVAGIQGFVPLEYDNNLFRASNPDDTIAEDKNENADVSSNFESEITSSKQQTSENASNDGNVNTDNQKNLDSGNNIQNVSTVEEKSDHSLSSEDLLKINHSSDNKISQSGESASQKTAIVNNNAQEKYSHDASNTHSLSFTAGTQTGRSLSSANFIRTSQIIPNSVSYQTWATPFGYSSEDGSYSFEYSTPLQSRHEISDSSGNVYGRYSFKNEAGDNDLWYVAGSSTGFLPVGGSLLASTGFPQNKQNNELASRSGDEAHQANSENSVKAGNTFQHVEELEENENATSIEDHQKQNDTITIHENMDASENVGQSVSSKNSVEKSNSFIDAETRKEYIKNSDSVIKRVFPSLDVNQFSSPSHVHLFLPSGNENEREFGYVFHSSY